MDPSESCLVHAALTGAQHQPIRKSCCQTDDWVIRPRRFRVVSVQRRAGQMAGPVRPGQSLIIDDVATGVLAGRC